MKQYKLKIVICTAIAVLLCITTALNIRFQISNRSLMSTSTSTTTKATTTTTTTKPETTTTITTTTTSSPTTTKIEAVIEIKTTTKPETTTTTTSKSIAEDVKAALSPIEKSVSSPKTSSEKFRITVYTPYSDGGQWGYQTATGVRSTHLQTCAVDPNVIPLGSTIMINGLTLKAVDVGGAVKGNHIDIFFDGTSAEARAWLEDFGEYHTVTIL